MPKKKYNGPSPFERLKPFEAREISRLKAYDSKELSEQVRERLEEAYADLNEIDRRVARDKQKAHDDVQKEIRDLKQHPPKKPHSFEAEDLDRWRRSTKEHKKKLEQLSRKLASTPPPDYDFVATEKEYKMKAVACIVRLLVKLLRLSEGEKRDMDRALYIVAHYRYKQIQSRYEYAEDAAEAVARQIVHSVYDPAIRASRRGERQRAQRLRDRRRHGRA